MKVTDFWNDEQKALLSYVPDPANRQEVVESLISALPRTQPAGSNSGSGLDRHLQSTSRPPEHDPTRGRGACSLRVRWHSRDRHDDSCGLQHELEIIASPSAVPAHRPLIDNVSFCQSSFGRARRVRLRSWGELAAGGEGRRCCAFSLALGNPMRRAIVHSRRRCLGLCRSHSARRGLSGRIL